MSIGVDSGWLAAVFLVSIRFGALFVMAPVFGGIRVPAQFRALFVIALSATLVTALGAKLPDSPITFGSLLLGGISELMVGALLAFGLFAGFGVFMLAGKILDEQIGFTIGSVFDPVTRAQSPLLGMTFNMLAIMLFFALDAHHMLMRGIAYSLEQLPPGTFFQDLSLAPVLAQFGTMFVLALTLVAPVVLALLLVDIGLGVMSRTMPQINMFTIGIPAKIVVGMLVLVAAMGSLGPIMARIFQSIFVYWQRLLG